VTIEAIDDVQSKRSTMTIEAIDDGDEQQGCKIRGSSEHIKLPEKSGPRIAAEPKVRNEEVF
jgi:hypothetical protein